MELKFDVDADLFMRVRRAVGTEETRYYLTGVLIEPDPDGGAWLVATDGRALLVARDESATAPKSAVINLSLMERSPDFECDEDSCRMSTPSYTGRRLRFDLDQGPDALALIAWQRGDNGERAIASHVVDGDKFPNWRGVWTSTKARETKRGHDGFGLMASLLHRVTGGEPVQLVDRGPGMAQGLLFSDVPEMVGLIMPCAVRTGGRALMDVLWPAQEDADDA